MNHMKWVIGGITAVLFMIVLLFSTVERISFDLNYYKSEYQKHHIAQEIGINMDELLIVTDNMLQYLKGNRKNLDMKAQIKGVDREVFNEKEKAHMVDVQELFLKGYKIRNISIILGIILLIILLRWKKNGIRMLFRSLEIVIGLIIGLTSILAILLYIDFNKYFTIFHHIFFNNNLWLLDPRTDVLIQIVPEPFFFDTAIKIVTYFVVEIIVLLVISIGVIRYSKRNCKVE